MSECAMIGNDLLPAATALKEFIRETSTGSCKILSQGDECQCQLCNVDRLQSEIAQLRADLERSLAREAVYTTSMKHLRHDLESGNSIELMIALIHKTLSNPNPAVAELLRDREIAREAITIKTIWLQGGAAGWSERVSTFWDMIEGIAREIMNTAIAAEEEPSHPDPNEVATPDVVADLQSGRW